MSKRLIIILIGVSFAFLACKGTRKEGSGFFGIFSSNSDKDEVKEDTAIEPDSILVSTPEEEKIQTELSKLPLREYVIEGTVIGGAGYAILLDRLEVGKIEPLVSQEINAQGKFRFTGKLRQPDLFQLRLPDGVIHVPVKPGDVLNFNINFENPTNFEVEGSLEPVYLREAYFQIEKVNDLKDEVEHMIEETKEARKVTIMLDTMNRAVERINKIRSDNLKAIVDRIDTAFTAILITQRLYPEDDYAFMNKIVKKFEKIYPYSSFYIGLRDKTKSFDHLANGKNAPEIIPNDVNNKTIRLSSTRGKYTVLMFWSSWCTECIDNFPRYRNLKKQYQSKGFEIFAVSLDNERDEWVQALKKYEMPWINVFDVGAYNSTSAQLYQVKMIPSYIIIDKEGIIRHRTFYLNDLEQTIKKLVK